MQLNKTIQEHLITLPTTLQNEVLDFVLSLEEKHQKQINKQLNNNNLDFNQAMNYTLDKNAELYKRLS